MLAPDRPSTALPALSDGSFHSSVSSAPKLLAREPLPSTTLPRLHAKTASHSSGRCSSVVDAVAAHVCPLFTFCFAFQAPLSRRLPGRPPAFSTSSSTARSAAQGSSRRPFPPAKPQPPITQQTCVFACRCPFFIKQCAVLSLRTLLSHPQPLVTAAVAPRSRVRPSLQSSSSRTPDSAKRQLLSPLKHEK